MLDRFIVQNNPVNRIDPMGLDWKDAQKGLEFGFKASGVVAKYTAAVVAKDIATALMFEAIEMPYLLDKIAAISMIGTGAHNGQSRLGLAATARPVSSGSGVHVAGVAAQALGFAAPGLAGLLG